MITQTSKIIDNLNKLNTPTTRLNKFLFTQLNQFNNKNKVKICYILLVVAYWISLKSKPNNKDYTKNSKPRCFDGSVYTGYFKDSEQHGPGIQVNSNGDKYIGWW